MKKIILIIGMIALLTSCGMTQGELVDYNIKQRQHCDELGVGYRVGRNTQEVHCDTYIKDPVMKCIKEYTNGIDEKYNNPDTVSDLREDDYSNVVKTCNEVFGKTNKQLGTN